MGEFNLIRYIPAPLQIINVYIDDFSLLFFVHSKATFVRTILSFLLGSLFGIIISLLMAWNRLFKAWMNPLIFIVKPIPVLALIPLFILWFGIGEIGKIFYITLGCFFIVVIVSSEAINNVPTTYLWAASSLGATQREVYWKVVFPTIVPAIMGGLRVAITIAFPLCLAAEFMGAQSGIGFYMIKAQTHLKIPKMIAGVIILTFLAIIGDTIVKIIGDYVTRWTERKEALH